VDAGANRQKTRRWLGGAALLLTVPALTGLLVWYVETRRSWPGAGAEGAEPAAERVARSFPTDGVRAVMLRAGAADAAEVVTVSGADGVEVSGVPAGGARGYHPPDPNWRETPPAEWGLDFVSARHGDVLVISTRGEISYIHHHYALRSLVLRVPAGVEVVREQRELTGDGGPDLRPPRP
jgi:hypothetical protein